MRRTVGLLFPGAWILFAIWALQQDDAIRSAAEPYALYFCYGSLAAAALISWYYDSMRLLAVALAVGSILWFLETLPPGSSLAWVVVGFIFAADFTLFAGLHERGVLTAKGILSLLLVGGQFAVIRFGVPPQRWSLPASSQLVWTQRGVLVAAAVLILVFIFRHRTKVEHGLFWSFAACALGMTTGGTLFYGGAAGLIIMFAVLEYGHDIAYLDELTSLPGRRAFNQQLTRLGRKYCIAMCDVDHFKRFNDAHGHDAGDQALRMVAARLSEVEGGGKVFRYGGEEFALVFDGRGSQETAPHLEALRNTIATEPFTLRAADRSVVNALTAKSQGKEPEITTITVSIGLAERDAQRTSAELVLEAADKALYRAKALGRNRLVTARDAESHTAAEKS